MGPEAEGHFLSSFGVQSIMEANLSGTCKLLPEAEWIKDARNMGHTMKDLDSTESLYFLSASSSWNIAAEVYS